MNRTPFLPLVIVFTVSQLAITPLRAQAENLLPPTNSADTSVVLGKEEARTLLQYMLTLPCQGWNTTTLTLSGFPARTTTPIAEQSNNFIDQDLLKEYNCTHLAKRVLQRGQRKIIIEAYQFATKDGAYGIYCAAHKGSTSYLPQGDASSEDQDSISFCKDQYYAYLYSTAPDDDEAKATISKLAKQLIDYIKPIKDDQAIVPAKSQPEIFAHLPMLERLPGSEKLIMGPTSLKRFYPAPYSSNLTPLIEGVAADYKLEYPDRDRVKLLIAGYASAQQAKLIFENYVDILRSTNKEKSVEGYVYPTVLFKVLDNFLLCQLRDKNIIVINGARHKDSVGELIHEIYF